MTTPFLTRAALSILLAIQAPVALAETLSDTLRAAYRNSGLLEQNRALLRAADEDVAAATAALRPVLSYSLSGNYSSLTQTTSANLGLSASLLIYDFGASDLRRDIARENVLSLREALRGLEQDVLLRAVNAFMAVRRDTAIVNLRRNNVRLIERELQAARDRFEVGEITRTDVALAEARLASARSALAAAGGGLDIAREEFRAAAGHAPATLEEPPAAAAPAGSVAAARGSARANHPDMAQARHSVRVAELNVDLARAAMRPRLTGSASAGLAQGGADSGSLGLSFGGPIYQGGALTGAIRRAQAQADAARVGLRLTQQAVDQAVANARSQIDVSDAALAASREQIRAARVALEGVREEASLGARTTLDVLNAEQELLDAEAAGVAAETDRFVAHYRLLAAMGHLNTVHLGLGIATYDPAAYYNQVRNAPVSRVSPEGEKLDHILKSLGKQ